MEKVTHWLEELSQSTGNSFSFDEHGRCFLGADNNINMIIHGNSLSSVFSLYVHLDTIPQEQQFDYYQFAMQVNFEPAITGGGALCVDKGDDTLFLRYSLDAELIDFTGFSNLLTNIADLGAQIKDKLAELNNVTPVQSADLPQDISLLRI